MCTIVLASCVFCSFSNMSTAFLRCCVELKEFQLSYAKPLINVSSKTADQSEDPGGWASIAAFAYSSKLAWKLFYLPAKDCFIWWGRIHFVSFSPMWTSICHYIWPYYWVFSLFAYTCMQMISVIRNDSTPVFAHHLGALASCLSSKAKNWKNPCKETKICSDTSSLAQFHVCSTQLETSTLHLSHPHTQENVPSRNGLWLREGEEKKKVISHWFQRECIIKRFPPKVNLRNTNTN